MKYFFHVIGNEAAFEDYVGEDFLTYDRALRHAVDVARELLKSGGFEHCTIVVEDEEDGEIARVSVRSAAILS